MLQIQNGKAFVLLPKTRLPGRLPERLIVGSNVASLTRTRSGAEGEPGSGVEHVSRGLLCLPLGLFQQLGMELLRTASVLVFPEDSFQLPRTVGGGL